jgi:hypothetical protein
LLGRQAINRVTDAKGRGAQSSQSSSLASSAAL